MDLTKNRYDTFDELREYCYRVASVVGLICIEIFGHRNPQTREYAVNLGLALQLTNILRDVHTDWQQNRIYIPQEEMARFGYTEQALAQGDYNAAFIDLMQFQAQRAWDLLSNSRKIASSRGPSYHVFGTDYGQNLCPVAREDPARQLRYF